MKKPVFLKVSGRIELSEGELLKVLRHLVLKMDANITDAVTKVVEADYGLTPTRVESNKDLTKVVAIIDSPYDAEVKEIKPNVEPSGESRGFVRRWKGFYNAAQDIFEELRKKKMHSISFDDFYERVLEVSDPSGGKRFIKKDEDGKQLKIEPWRVKQYTSPSQLKKTPQMKGIKWDPKKEEFRF